MSRVLVVDLDGTLIASPPCDGTREGIRAWEASVASSPPPPVEGAIVGLGALAQDYTSGTIYFVSARGPALIHATERWLNHYLPGIGGFVRLTGNRDTAATDGIRGKVRAIDDLVTRYAHVTLVDDDIRLSCLLRRTDVFHHAPGCWR